MMRILAATGNGLVDVGPRETVLDHQVDMVVRGDDAWWAIAEGHRVLTSPDARTWEGAADLRGLRATCVLPTPTLIGTSEAHLVSVSGRSSQRVRSFDRIPTRDAWYTPWGGPPDTRSLTRDAGGIVYANVHVGGILRSADGQRWKATAMDVDADVHQVLAHPVTPGFVFAATAIGLATSDDAGATWTFTDDGLHAAYCRAVAVAGDVLLLSASRSHTGRQAALYRAPAAGGAFERCTRGLPEWFADNVDTYCLDARGPEAAVGTSDGRVFTSSDAGSSWNEIDGTLPPISAIALA